MAKTDDVFTVFISHKHEDRVFEFSTGEVHKLGGDSRDELTASGVFLSWVDRHFCFLLLLLWSVVLEVVLGAYDL